MNKKRIKISSGIALVAVIAFWLGGFLWFYKSDDWLAIKALISTSDVVHSKVGDVEEVSMNPFGFSYRSGGGWAKASLDVDVVGVRGSREFKVELERKKWQWGLVSVSSD